MRNSLHIAAIAVLMAANTTACSGCDDESPLENDGPNLPTCDVDPDQVARRTACLADTDCPCGTHCDLGLCVAACSSDDACAGDGVCDAYGRCREAGYTSIFPVPEGTDLGEVVLSSSRLEYVAGAANSVSFDVYDADVSRMRIVARGGVTLTCDGEAGATECVLEDLAAGSYVTLEYSVDGDLGDDSEIAFYTEQGRQSASVVPLAANEPLVSRALASNGSVGHWKGSAVLTSAGIGAPAPTELRAEFPIEAEIHEVSPDAYVIVIKDDFHAFSRGELIGSASASDASFTFPSQALFSGRVTRDSGYEVVSEYIDTTDVSDTGSLLTFSFTQRFLGVSDPQEAPQLGWTIALGKTTEPLTGDAPDVPVSDALTTDPIADRDALFPIEQLFRDETRIDAQTLDDAALVALARQYTGAGETTNLNLCGYMDETALRAVSQRAASSAWAIGERFTFPHRTPASTLQDAQAPALEIVSQAFPAAAELFGASSNGVRQDVEISIDDSLAGRALLHFDATSTLIPCRGTAELDIVRDIHDDTACMGVFIDSEEERRTVPFDFCDQVEAEYGCSVVDLMAPSEPFRIGRATVNAVVPGETCVSHDVQAENARATTVCRLPRVPSRCVEGIECMSATGAQGTTGTRYGDEFLETSGDTSCDPMGGAVEQWAAIALDTRATGSITTSNALLGTCVRELAAFRDSALALGTPDLDYDLDLVSNEFDLTAGCVDGTRILLASSVGLEHARAGYGPMNDLASAGTNAAARLIERWLLLHGEIAAEKETRAELDQMFGANLGSDGDVLTTAYNGFDLMFHPRIASALARMPARALAAPDYRPVLTENPAIPQGRHLIGLPASIYEVAADQIGLAASAQERATRRMSDDADGIMHGVVPRALLAVAFANGMASRVEPGSPDPANWWSDFEGAEQKLGRQLGRAIAAYTLDSTGANPLGIEDTDLPLYFAGDEQGASQRFSAISDYILGGPSNTSAWVPVLVERALDSLDSAQASYSAQIDRAYRAEVEDARVDRQIEPLIQDFQGQLIGFCGPQIGLLATADSFDPDSCFVDDTPECRGVDVRRYAALTRDDWRASFCPHEEAQARYGADRYGFIDSGMRAFAGLQCDQYQATEDCSGDESPCVKCLQGGSEVGEVPLRPGIFRVNIPAVIVGSNAPSPTDAAIVSLPSDVIRDGIERACGTRYPSARPLPSVDFERRAQECMHGSIGDAAIQIYTSQRATQLASQDVSNFVEAYDIAVQSCNELLQGNSAIEGAIQSHNNQMQTLRIVRTAALAVASVAGGVKDCASGNKVGCVAAGAEALANVAALGVEAEMDRLVDAHDLRVRELEGERDYSVCMNDARLELVGIKSAQIEATQALFDELRAVQLLADEKLDAFGVWETGKLLIADLERSKVERPRGGDWTSLELLELVRDMRAARRAVYLGVRAVEYEYQTSLTLRDDVLRASTPLDLQAIVDQLWSESNTRSINNARPDDFKVVISLREDVLGLDSAANASDETAWQAALTSKTSIVREGGKATGRSIAFDLTPDGVVTPSGSTTIFDASDCAERIWSVNANIVGLDGGSPAVNDDGTLARVEIRKANVFESRWCEGKGDGSDLQRSSVRPSYNLFREPGVDDVGPETTSDPRTTFTRARVEAGFNVDRSTFDSDDYTNGDSLELAGRGVFGRYEIFIPENELAIDTSGEGVYFPKVEDILLRIDYVSVAK